MAAAVERGTAALAGAKDRIVPVALDAKDRLMPLAAEAAERIVPLMQEAAAKARPAVTTAVARVTDVVDSEVKPRLVELLDDAQRDAHVTEAAKRSRATVAALRGDLALPADTTKSRKKGHPILKAIGVAVIVALIVAAVRNMLGPRDDGWEFDDEDDELSDDTTQAGHNDEADFEATQPIQPGRRGEPEPPEAVAEASDSEARAEADIPAEPTLPVPAEAPATADNHETVDDLGDPFRYGEGSFIGPNPPEGYTIKGNERSMKYHVPGALAYDRCSTTVWFNSPEAAERAGFLRAER
jgi:hypothetical protein